MLGSRINSFLLKSRANLTAPLPWAYLFLVSVVDVITVGYPRLLSNSLPIRASSSCLPSQTIIVRHMVEHKRMHCSLTRYLSYIPTSQLARSLAMLAGKSGNPNPDTSGRYQVEEVCYKIHWLPTYALGSYPLLTPWQMPHFFPESNYMAGLKRRIGPL